MSFYHFTSRWHTPSIDMTGEILPVESNVRHDIEHAGPDVVWLLDTPTATDYPHGLVRTDDIDKTAVRIEVNVPAIRWLDWAWTATMRQFERDALVESGGGLAAAEHWYIWPAAIPRSRWVEVTMMATGHRLELLGGRT